MLGAPTDPTRPGSVKGVHLSVPASAQSSSLDVANSGVETPPFSVDTGVPVARRRSRRVSVTAGNAEAFVGGGSSTSRRGSVNSNYNEPVVRGNIRRGSLYNKLIKEVTENRDKQREEFEKQMEKTEKPKSGTVYYYDLRTEDPNLKEEEEWQAKYDILGFLRQSKLKLQKRLKQHEIDFNKVTALDIFRVMPEEDVVKLREQFIEWERADGGSQLTVDRFVDLLMNCLKTLGYDGDAEEERGERRTLVDVFNAIDYDGSGTVDWDEFTNYMMYSLDDNAFGKQDERLVLHPTKSMQISKNAGSKGDIRYLPTKNYVQLVEHFDDHVQLSVVDNQVRNIMKEGHELKFLETRKDVTGALVQPELEGYSRGGIAAMMNKALKNPIVARLELDHATTCVEYIPDIEQFIVMNHRWSARTYALHHHPALGTKFVQQHAGYVAKPALVAKYSSEMEALFGGAQSGEVCVHPLSGIESGDFKPSATILCHEEPVASILPVPRMGRVISSCVFGGVSVSDARRGTLINVLGKREERETGVHHMLYMPELNLLVTAGHDPSLQIWMVAQKSSRDPYVGTLVDNIVPHKHSVIGLWQDQKRIPNVLVSADAGGMLKLWDMRKMRCLETSHLFPTAKEQVFHAQSMTSIDQDLKFLLFGTSVVTHASKVMEVSMVAQYILDREQQEKKMNFLIQTKTVYNLYTRQIIAAINNHIVAYDFTTGKVCAFHDQVAGDNETISCIAMDRRGRRLYVGTDKGTLFICSASTGEVTFTYYPCEAEITFIWVADKALIVCTAAGRTFVLDADGERRAHLASYLLSSPITCGDCHELTGVVCLADLNGNCHQYEVQGGQSLSLTAESEDPNAEAEAEASAIKAAVAQVTAAANQRKLKRKQKKLNSSAKMPQKKGDLNSRASLVGSSLAPGIAQRVTRATSIGSGGDESEIRSDADTTELPQPEDDDEEEEDDEDIAAETNFATDQQIYKYLTNDAVQSTACVALNPFPTFAIADTTSHICLWSSKPCTTLKRFSRFEHYTPRNIVSGVAKSVVTAMNFVTVGARSGKATSTSLFHRRDTLLKSGLWDESTMSSSMGEDLQDPTNDLCHLYCCDDQGCVVVWDVTDVIQESGLRLDLTSLALDERVDVQDVPPERATPVVLRCFVVTQGEPLVSLCPIEGEKDLLLLGCSSGNSVVMTTKGTLCGTLIPDQKYKKEPPQGYRVKTFAQLEQRFKKKRSMTRARFLWDKVRRAMLGGGKDLTAAIELTVERLHEKQPKDALRMQREADFEANLEHERKSGGAVDVADVMRRRASLADDADSSSTYLSPSGARRKTNAGASKVASTNQNMRVVLVEPSAAPPPSPTGAKTLEPSMRVAVRSSTSVNTIDRSTVRGLKINLDEGANNNRDDQRDPIVERTLEAAADNLQALRVQECELESEYGFNSVSGSPKISESFQAFATVTGADALEEDDPIMLKSQFVAPTLYEPSIVAALSQPLASMLPVEVPPEEESEDENEISKTSTTRCPSASRRRRTTSSFPPKRRSTAVGVSNDSIASASDSIVPFHLPSSNPNKSMSENSRGKGTSATKKMPQWVRETLIADQQGKVDGLLIKGVFSKEDAPLRHRRPARTADMAKLLGLTGIPTFLEQLNQAGVDDSSGFATPAAGSGSMGRASVSLNVSKLSIASERTPPSSPHPKRSTEGEAAESSTALTTVVSPPSAVVSISPPRGAQLKDATVGADVALRNTTVEQHMTALQKSLIPMGVYSANPELPPQPFPLVTSKREALQKQIDEREEAEVNKDKYVFPNHRTPLSGFAHLKEPEELSKLMVFEKNEMNGQGHTSQSAAAAAAAAAGAEDEHRRDHDNVTTSSSTNVQLPVQDTSLLCTATEKTAQGSLNDLLHASAPMYPLQESPFLAPGRPAPSLTPYHFFNANKMMVNNENDAVADDDGRSETPLQPTATLDASTFTQRPPSSQGNISGASGSLQRCTSSKKLSPTKATAVLHSSRGIRGNLGGGQSSHSINATPFTPDEEHFQRPHSAFGNVESTKLASKHFVEGLKKSSKSLCVMHPDFVANSMRCASADLVRRHLTDTTAPENQVVAGEERGMKKNKKKTVFRNLSKTTDASQISVVGVEGDGNDDPQTTEIPTALSHQSNAELHYTTTDTVVNDQAAREMGRAATAGMQRRSAASLPLTTAKRGGDRLAHRFTANRKAGEVTKLRVPSQRPQSGQSIAPPSSKNASAGGAAHQPWRPAMGSEGYVSLTGVDGMDTHEVSLTALNDQRPLNRPATADLVSTVSASSSRPQSPSHSKRRHRGTEEQALLDGNSPLPSHLTTGTSTPLPQTEAQGRSPPARPHSATFSSADFSTIDKSKRSEVLSEIVSSHLHRHHTKNAEKKSVAVLGGAGPAHHPPSPNKTTAKKKSINRPPSSSSVAMNGMGNSTAGSGQRRSQGHTKTGALKKGFTNRDTVRASSAAKQSQEKSISNSVLKHQQEVWKNSQKPNLETPFFEQDEIKSPLKTTTHANSSNRVDNILTEQLEPQLDTLAGLPAAVVPESATTRLQKRPVAKGSASRRFYEMTSEVRKNNAFAQPLEHHATSHVPPDGSRHITGSSIVKKRAPGRVASQRQK